MKTVYSVLAILTASAIIGMVTIGSQQIYAPRMCGGCEEKFSKLTTEFEKSVKAAYGDPDEVSRLVDEYAADVKALLASPSPSP